MTGAAKWIGLSLAAAALAGAASQRPDPPADYLEEIPATGVAFGMVAVTPPPDSGLQPFWIGRTEVTWDEYEVFYFGEVLKELPSARAEEVDAVSRPTPPYGAADRGFGTGKQPAIGMTHFAARQYCLWLSAATGRRYRLPTEAEWQAACDQSTQPAQTGAPGWFAENSGRRPHPVGSFPAPGWKAVDLLGNVAEFTSTPWDENEPDRFVLKGGSYLDPVQSCRDRAPTTPQPCLVTDPQIPKSRWWYSDCFQIGFRLLREAEP